MDSSRQQWHKGESRGVAEGCPAQDLYDVDERKIELWAGDYLICNAGFYDKHLNAGPSPTRRFAKAILGGLIGNPPIVFVPVGMVSRSCSASEVKRFHSSHWP
jgi:hypothetical protein